MKQGLNFHLEVQFLNIDLNDIEKIEFLFSDGNHEKRNVYPKDVIRKKDTPDVLLVPFLRTETYLFKDKIQMDTRIFLKGIENQPETPIITFKMSPTLFKREGDLNIDTN